METTKPLIDRLRDEKDHKISGGIYNLLQVDMAYNSNHMEGSRLTHEQTRYIYETHTFESDTPVSTDDIVETINHFRCFDYMLDHYNEPLSEEFIKHMHFLLKTGTFSARSKEAVIGEYKFYPNYVGEIKTALPKDVHKDMASLLNRYNSETSKTFDSILGLHADFERIHPFYDGNGRVGRLVMFKECLKSNVVPFIITDEYKAYYIRGLYQWQTGREKGYLRDTCLLMQDNMKSTLDYFQIPYKAESPA